MRDYSLNSGERLAALRFDDIFCDHVARYEFAANYLKEKNYRFGLDLFCGSGYGTVKLAETLTANIFGIDGSLEAVTEASRRVGYSNVMFAHKFFPFSLPANWADFIVSFESLEHVENGPAFVHVMTQALAPGGTLIVSAPNSNHNSLILNPFPWHFRHYKPEEMRAAFEDKGLIFKQMLACDVTVHKNGKPVASNYFSTVRGPLRSGDDGDTCVCVFEKAE